MKKTVIKNVKQKLLIMVLPFILCSCHNVFNSAKATAVRLEAENATVTNADIKYVSGTGSYAFDVSGDGFVGFGGGDESKITFSYSSSRAGIFQINVKYAVGMDNSALKVECNDHFEIIDYPSNNGWGSFNITDPLVTKIRLNKGQNSIVLSRPAAGKYGEIDYIEICDCIEEYIVPDLPNGSTWTKYEAEEGEVVLGTRKSGNASGFTFVGNLDGDNSFIDFNLSNLEEGAYELKIKYATGFSERPIKVYAGERGREGRMDFYGNYLTNITSWGTFTYAISCFIGLKSNSFIRVQCRYVEIDYIELSEKVGDYFAGVSHETLPDEDITDDGFEKLGEDYEEE